MNVLAVDTSGDVGTIGITRDGMVLVERAERATGRHGEMLIDSLDSALRDAAMTISDIDLLAVGLGPGSFTGVRIGVATLKGLAIARGTPLVGIPTSRVLARGTRSSLCAPVIDAHKGEVFVALYRRSVHGGLELELGETHGRPERMATLLRQRLEGRGCTLVGNGLTKYREAIVAELSTEIEVAEAPFEVPRGSILAQEALDRYRSSGPDDLASLEPLYVRPSDAVLPANASSGGVT